MSEWKKSGKYSSLEEFVFEKQHKSLYEIWNNQRLYQIRNLDKVALKLIEASKTKELVTVVGDYDSDGINSLYEMSQICMALGLNYNIIIPKRFSEGYGLSEKIINRIQPGGLLITIDNGISAIDSIKKAKEKGMYVIVLDHHIAKKDENGNIILSPADIIIDPEAMPETADYTDYCGAGLAYKLAELIFPPNHPVLYKILCSAAIGTIGDVVPLTEDNRRIVQMGMQLMKLGNQSKGLKSLMDVCQITEHSTSEDIAFQLIPCINAPGRLEDDGGKLALKTLYTESEEEATNLALQMQEVNKKRKELVERFFKEVPEEHISNDVPIICYYNPEIPEGIIGIIAGKLTELSHKCAFVFTKTENGYLKGSARNHMDNVNLEELLHKNKNLLIQYGGHKKAAALVIEEEKLTLFQKSLENILKDEVIDRNTYYDLELSENDIFEVRQQLSLLEPFGEGNPKPIFRIRAEIGNKFGEKIKLLGEKKNHIKFFFKDFTAIGFNLAEKYKNQSYTEIDMIGTLEINVWNGKENIQFRILDYKKA